jgi:hypothetical protein
MDTNLRLKKEIEKGAKGSRKLLTCLRKDAFSYLLTAWAIVVVSWVSPLFGEGEL